MLVKGAGGRRLILGAEPEPVRIFAPGRPERKDIVDSESASPKVRVDLFYVSFEFPSSVIINQVQKKNARGDSVC
jgi:hypothetical protein